MILLVLGFFSCTKYEDGPSLSLVSKKKRVANSWRIDQYLLNDVDRTYDYRTIVTRENYTFFTGGSWQYTEASTWSWAKAYDTGHWNLISNKEHLEMISDDPHVPYREFQVLRLTSDEMWLKRTAAPDSIVELHLVTDTE